MCLYEYVIAMFPTRKIAVGISFLEEPLTGATLSNAPINLSEKGAKTVVSDSGDCGPSMEHSDNEHIISPYPSCLAAARKIIRTEMAGDGAHRT